MIPNAAAMLWVFITTSVQYCVREGCCLFSAALCQESDDILAVLFLPEPFFKPIACGLTHKIANIGDSGRHLTFLNPFL